MSKFHVDQIATRVRQGYEFDHKRKDLDEVNNLSRYLALYASDRTIATTATPGQRITEVTDGTKDRGIDAISVDPAGKVIVFTQSKWRQEGQGGLAVDETLRFIDGVRSLVGMSATGEPVHAARGIAAHRDLPW